jgi:hypothetical protein
MGIKFNKTHLKYLDNKQLDEINSHFFCTSVRITRHFSPDLCPDICPDKKYLDTTNFQ